MARTSAIFATLTAICLGPPLWPEDTVRVVGRSYFISNTWLQYLGRDEGDPLWLYPHLDGVGEIFRATDGRVWPGSLESRFDPSNGRLINRFHAAEVLNELLDSEATRSARRRAARLLKLFVALHGGEPPYYLKPHLKRIEKDFGDNEQAWVTKRLEFHQRATQDLDVVGTRIRSLRVASSPDLAGEYYRRMLADGYFDIALIGGNSKDKDTGKYYSWHLLEALRQELDRMGFRRSVFRRAADAALSSKTERILGNPIVVRVNITGGSIWKPRIRRAVANFVEGVAHSDVVIYHGHSNYASGSYFASETLSGFSRFQIGMKNQQDIERKFHGLGTLPHQIVALQSCSSYEKYCRPLRWFFEERADSQDGSMGFMGNANKAYFADFIPRYTTLFEMLLAGKGPKDIHLRINSIRPLAKTPPMVLRGVLQPRLSFIVPDNVTVSDFHERPDRDGNLVTGLGSDGKRYFSTEVFAQNYAGEVVQVVASLGGLYGLMDDGRLFFVSAGTGGAMVESEFTSKTRERFTFISPATHGRGKPRLLLIGKHGGVYYHARHSQRLHRSTCQPPAGVTFTAIGNDSEGRLIGVDTERNSYAWNRKRRRFEPVAELAPLTNASPSLLGHGVAGRLWRPD